MDLSKSLNFAYDMSVESAYIITIKDHAESERLAKGCQRSCDIAGMPWKTWDAFDATDGKTIKIPEHSKSSSWLKWVKLYDHHLSITEIACFFSHASLWARCLEMDRPIVILEHDAIMVQRYPHMTAYNSIVYLGGEEQKRSMMPIGTIPPHGSLNNNYHFICRAHAYAIDPAMAKNLLGTLVQRGICESLDVIMRADLFNISQAGLFAYDRFEGTTIVNRKKDVSLKDENVGNER